MVVMEKGEIFHVHTFRCGHAAEVSDEAYVIKAMESYNMYRRPFWEHVKEEDAIIIGHDAHSPKELERKLPAGFEGNKSL